MPDAELIPPEEFDFTKAEKGQPEPEPISVPGATHFQFHPILPYGENPVEVEVNGRKFLVKESDLDLINLEPQDNRPWRKQFVSDYHVAVHRGWIRAQNIVQKANTQRFQMVNPGNLGFCDATRNKQVAATYKIDENKVDVIHKLWRNHLALAKQWAKVDTLKGEKYDFEKWAKANSKRMHPLIRTWYRFKVAVDKMEEFGCDSSAAAGRYAEAVKKQCDMAIKIEGLIHTTGRYLDALLERRIAEQRKKKPGAPIDADATVVAGDFSDLRMVDVDREIAKVRDELLDGEEK